MGVDAMHAVQVFSLHRIIGCISSSEDYLLAYFMDNATPPLLNNSMFVS